MTSIMAKYAYIFWGNPADGDVQARNQAVEALSAYLAALPCRQAINIAAAITRSFSGEALAANLAAKVEDAIVAHAAAFVLRENEQQGVVCLAVSALKLVRAPLADDSGWTAADAIAASLWSALALQDQVEHGKMEELRQDLMTACRDRVRAVAKEARRRHSIPDVGLLTISETDPAGSKANTALRRAIKPVIKAVKENQDLDREELDILWWLMGDYSELLDCPLEEQEPFCRAIATGLEGATMLRRLPSDGLRYAILRCIEKSEALTLAELMAELKTERAELGKVHIGSWAATDLTVFPLISALATTGNIAASSVKLDARGWGARALLEGAIVAMEGRVSGAR
ncbi:GTPase-associated system all-helical protein GASH [Novacetimonas sp. GS1]|uniref:GTPase-associated system all-helical protein GASH n=1 Tax=Novacetimonas sp. GS1 TaxID=3119990 RepID=UPI002FCCCB14